MKAGSVQISKIIDHTTSKQRAGCYSVCWIQKKVQEIQINKTPYRDIENAIFFLHPDYDWKITKKNASESAGYILYLSRSVMDHPIFKNLHITQVRLFGHSETPRINLAPGIEKRIQSILEMLDELLSTNLNHREDAILSLLNTFFIYCDGKCNIRSLITNTGSKSVLVYNYKKLIDRHLSEYHRVFNYAGLLNVSEKYLNESVSEVLGVSAKTLIAEQLVMRARHQLKFTDKAVKEIAFGMGFSSPDYFSSFFKKHTGYAPSEFRKL